MAFCKKRDLDPLSRDSIATYLGWLAERRKPATVSVRFRALQQWFRWLHEEDEIDANPMARMRRPRVPEQPVPVLSEDELRRLLGNVKGRSFVDRRDRAIFMVLIDTGMRLGELAGIKVDDVEFHPRQRTEHRQLRKDAERQGWRWEDPSGGGYPTLRCPCPERHQKWVHLTPSNPNYYRQLRKWLARHTCWQEER